MSITASEKKSIVEKFGRNNKDTGSSEVQVALLTKRIDGLTDHFKTHTKDNHSRRGLIKLVNQRRRLLGYIKRSDVKKYNDLIGQLELRK